MSSEDWLDSYLARSERLTLVAREASARKIDSGSAVARESPHVYMISYSRNDTGSADVVELMLRRHGRKVWRDDAAMNPGDQVQDRIIRGIEAADTFIALWSHHYKGHTEYGYARGELYRAIKTLEQKQNSDQERPGPRLQRIVPIQLDDAELDLRLESVHVLSGRSRDEIKYAVEQIVASERSPR